MPARTGDGAAGKRGARRAARKTTSAAAKKKADAAAKAVADAAATGARLPGPAAALRNSMIVARAAQGVSWSEVAAEAGVTTRTCRRVVAQARKVPSPLEATPMELLESLAGGFARSIADYEALAFAWAETNQSAALGAKKAADETRARLAALMADVGKLPSNLELFRSEMEMVRIAELMHERLRALVAGEASAEEVFEFFRELATQRERRALPA